jgi:hypothetical protein
MFGGPCMLELVQHGRDVMGHGNVDVFLFVIPGNGETAEQSARPVFGDGVELAECAEEVHGVLFADILDAEIVHDKGEVNGTSVVRPQRRCDGDRAIAKLGQVGGEAVIGDAASLF